MVNPNNGEIKYIDFGEACNEKNCNLCLYGNIKNYLCLSQQFDLWSLGIIIYKMIIGEVSNDLFIENYNYEKDINIETINSFLKTNKFIDIININELLSINNRDSFKEK